MRWRFVAGDRPMSAVRAVDTATHPEFQRMGVFSTLTRAALEQLNDEVDFVYNTPNEKSLPGYLKMGWRTVGTMRVSIRVRRPLRFARSVTAGETDPRRSPPTVHAEPAWAVLDAVDDLSDLLAESLQEGPELSTAQSPEYLKWRYSDTSGLDYRAIRWPDTGRTRGIAVFRVRPRRGLWETAMLEVIVSLNDWRTRRRLIRGVLQSAETDHATCLVQRGTSEAGAALRSGFLPTRAGITLVVNPLRADIGAMPASSHSWALSLGDLEVF